MKTSPFTWGIISAGAFVFGTYGLANVLEIPFHQWEDWLISFGGMVFTGMLCGACAAIVVAALRYLYLEGC